MALTQDRDVLCVCAGLREDVGPPIAEQSMRGRPLCVRFRWLLYPVMVHGDFKPLMFILEEFLRLEVFKCVLKAAFLLEAPTGLLFPCLFQEAPGPLPPPSEPAVSCLPVHLCLSVVPQPFL